MSLIGSPTSYPTPGLKTTGLNFYPTNALNAWTGYGRLELGVARGLEALGVPLHIFPKPDAPTLVIGFAGWLASPAYAQTRKWIYTQSESTRVSQKWVELINWYAEGVLVTNPDLPAIYKACGIKRPVICVGHGIDLSVPVQAKPWDGESRFEWLTYSYGGTRKGGQLALMAYNEMWLNDPAHHLTIKSRPHDAGWLKGLKSDQVTVVYGQQSEHEWMDLLARSHAFVFPSLAEGFGMPPREATLIGLPTIATQWLGMKDVHNWGVPLHVRKMTMCNFTDEEANGAGGEVAEPDLEHLKDRMQWVYQNYEEARAIAMQGREYIRYQNDWYKVARNIAETIDAHGSVYR